MDFHFSLQLTGDSALKLSAGQQQHQHNTAEALYTHYSASHIHCGQRETFKVTNHGACVELIGKTKAARAATFSCDELKKNLKK